MQALVASGLITVRNVSHMGTLVHIVHWPDAVDAGSEWLHGEATNEATTADLNGINLKYVKILYSTYNTPDHPPEPAGKINTLPADVLACLTPVHPREKKGSCFLA